jgi:hypothetical protein
MKRDLILPVLRGGLWHTTHPSRFKSILQSCAILPEPEIPDAERFGSAAGREHYPYVRFLDGVSLFDLDQFDPAEYERSCPSSSWAYFIPRHLDWTCAVWIEIDREQVAPNLISARDLVSKWKTEEAFRKVVTKVERNALASRLLDYSGSQRTTEGSHQHRGASLLQTDEVNFESSCDSHHSREAGS